MPTPDQIREYRQWRGRFISAVWDAEADNYHQHPAVEVRTIVRRVGAEILPEHTVARLINDLVGDGLLEPFAKTAQASYPLEVKLTSYGRLEVEQWISEDVATPHLALPPSQVFNTHIHGNVTGSALVQGSTSTNVDMRTAVGEQIATLVAQAKELLATSGQSGDERNEVAADIEILEDASAPVGRVRAALHRIGTWATTAAVAGASAALSEDVHQLTGQILQQL